MDEKFDYLKTKLKQHKVFRFLKQFLVVQEITDIKRQHWENLESRQFLLVYVKANESYVAIFKHSETDEPDRKDGKDPFDSDDETETVTEIDFFSSVGLSEEEEKLIRKKDPSVYFGFNGKEIVTLEAKKEILFIILLRIFNFDLHFEEILHELENSDNKEKLDFIKAYPV